MISYLIYMSRILAQKICEVFSFDLSKYIIIPPKSLKKHFLGITFIVSPGQGHTRRGLCMNYDVCNVSDIQEIYNCYNIFSPGPRSHWQARNTLALWEHYQDLPMA